MNVNLQKYLKYKSKYLDLKNKYIGQSGGDGHIEESKLIKDVNNNIDKICDIYNDKNNINYQKLKEFIRKLLNSTNEILQIIERERKKREIEEIEEIESERKRESERKERERERERESERKERERERKRESERERESERKERERERERESERKERERERKRESEREREREIERESERKERGRRESEIESERESERKERGRERERKERGRERERKERGRRESERKRESERERKIEREKNDKIFYIYTTGIANWAGREIIDIWKECRYKNIINQIKGYNFNHIIIEHYDPILDDDGNKYDFEKEKEITEYIQNIIKTQDDTSQEIVGIKTKQTFKQEYLDYNSFLNSNKQHYIILDFAHVIYYYYNDTNSKYFMNNHITKQNLVNNLNCIHINFPSQNKCDNYWEKIKYFKYDKDSKKITSYIELFLEALSKNKDYLINTLDINSYIINNIINFYSVKNDLLKTIFYTKQIEIEIRNRLRIVEDKEVNKINQDNLYIEFFNKLFENNNNIFDINKYLEYQTYKQSLLLL
jgi:hypothetical protein